VVLNNLLKRKSIEVSDNGIILFNYFNSVELDALKSIENSLKYFLENAGFYVQEIDYQLDNDRQQLELYKQKQRDEIMNHLPAVASEDKFKKIKEDNEIKSKKISKIIDLNVEERTAVVIGQIFDLGVNETKNKYKIYKFTITDHSDSITLKAFANSNQSKKFNGHSCNLPESYLNSFKIGD